MTLRPFSRIINFCNEFMVDLNKRARIILPRIITALLCASGHPNFAILARSILTELRNRSSVMRLFKSKRFKSRSEYRCALNAVVKSIKKMQKGTWFLVLDGTSTRRGGFTKIDNAIRYKENMKNVKGRPSTKSHMFLMGILILPNGTRIPLERMTYYTKEYCRKTNRKHITIIELAVNMIKQAPIPEHTNVVVLADEYFEGKTVHAACTKLGYTYIMPVDRRRCMADKKGKRIPKTLHKHGLRIERSTMKKITLVTGKEKTVSYRRGAKSNSGKKREYRAYAEVCSVSGLGDVLVTYSHKKAKKKGKKSSDSYRVLICNNRELSAATVVEYYEIRWQIELFFRELKSVIGLEAFRGGDFQSFERFVDVVLMSVLFLENYRLQLIGIQPNHKLRAKMERARMAMLLQNMRKEIDAESLSYLIELAGISRRKKEELCSLLNGLAKAS